MKKHLRLLHISALIFFLFMGAQHSSQAQDLELIGVIDLSLGSTDGKGIHLIVNNNITDLSVYGVGIANNGGGTDGQEINFTAESVTAGTNILIARAPTALEGYFETSCWGEFDMIIQDDGVNQNGDDAIELFLNGAVIETFGYADVDGTGEAWEYTDSWAYKLNGVWIYGGVDCSDGSTTSSGSDCVYPICNLNTDDYWTGATNSSWSENTNWNDGTAPANSSNIFVYNLGNNQPALTTDLSLTKLKIGDGVNLSVSNSSSLTIDGDLIAISGGLSVASGSSVITKGRALGDKHKISRTTTFDTNTGKYSAIGSPVTGETTAVLGKIYYKYDETIAYGSGAQERFLAPTTAEAMSAGDAFFSAYTGDITFTGSLNTGDVSVPLVYDETNDGSAANAGYNLVSNPYPCAIDFSKLVSANSDITGSIYLWDDGGSNASQRTNGDYITVSEVGAVSGGSGRSGSWNGHIGSAQGFFVKANKTGTLLFVDDMKVAGNNADENFFRISKDAFQKLRLSLVNTTSLHADETLLGFSNQATPGFDRLYDAYKISATQGVKLFSGIEEIKGTPFAIQGLPYIADEQRIELGISVEEAGNYSLNIAEMGLAPDVKILLFDKVLNQSFELSAGNPYHFTSGPVKLSNRFSLLLNVRNVLASSSKLNDLNINHSIDGITLTNASGELYNARVSVFDHSGRVLLDTKIENRNSSVKIDFNFDRNKLYHIKVQNSNSMIVSKIAFN